MDTLALHSDLLKLINGLDSTHGGGGYNMWKQRIMNLCFTDRKTILAALGNTAGEEEIAALKKEIEKKDQEIEFLNEQLDDSDSKVNELKKEIDMLKKSVGVPRNRKKAAATDE